MNVSLKMWIFSFELESLSLIVQDASAIGNLSDHKTFYSTFQC